MFKLSLCRHVFRRQCTLQLVLTITVSRFSNTIQEAQLSLRNCALLHVPEYFAKSLKIIQTGNIQKLGHGFLFAFHSNYGSILYHFRESVILVENRDFFHTLHNLSNDAPVTVKFSGVTRSNTTLIIKHRPTCSLTKPILRDIIGLLLPESRSKRRALPIYS